MGSPRTAAPRAMATAGTKYTVTDARVGPARPARVANAANAAAVPKQPRAATASRLSQANDDDGAVAMPSGASAASATASARQITGSAP